MTDAEKIVVMIAIASAKNCIHVFESAYPGDDRPRQHWRPPRSGSTNQPGQIMHCSKPGRIELGGRRTGLTTVR